MRISRRASVIVLLCMGFLVPACNGGWYDVSSRGWKTEFTAADRKQLARLMQVFDSIICEESMGTTADLKHCYQYHARKIAEQGDTVITLGLPDHFADTVIQVLGVELVGKIWSIEGMTTNRSQGKSVDTWWMTGQSSMLTVWDLSDPPAIPEELIHRVRRVGLLSPSVHTYLFQKTEEVDFARPAVRWLYLTYLITWQKQTEDKLRLEEEVQH